MSKTIAAIATASGEASIGVVRISGDDAVSVADKVFKSASGKILAECNGYSALFGYVEADGEKIDEAVALVFLAPKSYTGENVVELSVHGGSFVVRKVLRAVLNSGAIMAAPGEFTRRAFENGKMSLNEAESVMDIISADGEQALRASLLAKSGVLSQKCGIIRDKLTFAAATVAAFSDFPDEEPEFSGIDKLETMLSEAEADLQRLLDTYDTGRMIRYGVNTVIIGPPNAGKSTLMNLLSGYERSIVTPIAGTTRDIVEETVNLDGLILKLSDTAGLRDTFDEVEQIGVKRAKERIDSADLIIAVVDSTEAGNINPEEIYKPLIGRLAVVVFNKSDIGIADKSYVQNLGLRFVEMSAKDGSGLDEFKSIIKEVTKTNNLSGTAEVYLNERQRDCVIKALENIKESLSALQSGLTVDAVGVLLDDALAALFELTGERVTVEVINKVFEHFCVGK